jgi:tRNA threonylcarbamoyladenosine biosynthesis protein TsaB
MLVLAFDTSTSVVSVAVARRGAVLASMAVARGRSQAAHLLSSIDKVLSDAGLDLADVEAVACAVGPGSFTGLRVGVASAQGLAEGRGLSVVGVPTLEAYAHGLSGVAGTLCPMVDARKQELYVAGYRWGGDGLVELWAPVACSPEGLADRVGEDGALLAGEGAAAYREKLEAALGPRGRFGPTDLASSNAGRVALLGAERLAEGAGSDPAALRPIYGRPSEAELATAQPRGEGE